MEPTDRPVAFCWMAADEGKPDRRAQQVEVLRDQTARHIMGLAHQRGWSLRALVESLIQSAAASASSGIVLDAHRRVLCSKDDATHIDDLCAQFRAALEREVAEARQDLLKTPIPVAPSQGRPF